MDRKSSWIQQMYQKRHMGFDCSIWEKFDLFIECYGFNINKNTYAFNHKLKLTGCFINFSMCIIKDVQGVTCSISKNYYICLNSCVNSFSIKASPNNHKLDWNNDKFIDIITIPKVINV